MSSPPKFTRNARKTGAGARQYLEEPCTFPAGPLKHSKPHLARSGSSAPSHTAFNEVRASSPTSSPPGYLRDTRASSLARGAQDEVHPSGPTSSPLEKSGLARLRSDTLRRGLNTSHSTSRSPSPEFREGWAADYLPAGFRVLPKSCYNYEPFDPPPPPPILPCSRAWLYSQIVSTSRPVFLSCNLVNPIHLASVIAFGQKWSVTEEVAGSMTPAMNIENMEDLGAWKGMCGVLVCGMTPYSMEKLEGIRSCVDGYERMVEDVLVELKDGDSMTVAAYVYRRSSGRKIRRPCC